MQIQKKMQTTKILLRNWDQHININDVTKGFFVGISTFLKNKKGPSTSTNDFLIFKKINYF
jgi:hypothetical protein